MSHWRRASFWVLFVALLIPSAFVFALPGAMFIDDDTFERRAAIILPLQAFVTLAVPYILARRLVIRRAQDAPGFPVIRPRVPGLDLALTTIADRHVVPLPNSLTSGSNAQAGAAEPDSRTDSTIPADAHRSSVPFQAVVED